MEARNRIVVAAIVVILLVGVAIWLQGNQGALIAKPPAAPVEQPAAPSLATADAQPIAARERVDVASESPAVPELHLDLAHVRGRCVDEAGAPLVGCTVKLDGWGSNANRMAMQGEVAWHDPEPIVTGTDGRFDVRFAPPSGLQFSLEVSTDGRVPRTGRWGRIKPEQDIDLGDVALQTGFAVRGRVVDEQGVPVAKVYVNLQNLPLPLAPDMAANNSRGGRSGEDGEFAIRVPIPAGTWSLDAGQRGVRLLGPNQLTVDSRDLLDVVVTVRRMPSIEGVVVDELGMPVKGVTIEAVLHRSGRMASGRSREDGSFTIHAVDAEPVPVRLAVHDPGPCEPPEQRDEKLWNWGSRDVRFVLRRSASFELTVVERDGEKPVTQYAVKCYAQRSRSSLQSNLRLSGEHPDGRVTVDRVWHGKNFLQVMPIDPALLPSAKIEFEAGTGGIAPMRVTLDRLQPAHVLLTTTTGQAVFGSKVEVLRRGSEPFEPDTYVPDPRTGSSGWSIGPQARPHEFFSAAETDAEGRAAVFVPRAREGLLLRVTGAHPRLIVEPAVFVDGQELTVVVPASGGIVGKVHLLGLEPTTISVEVRDDRDQQIELSRDAPKLQADGSFAVQGLAPGRYRLQLLQQVSYRTEHGSSGGSSVLDLQIPEVLVEADKDTTIEIDASSLAPATIIGRVMLDGAVPTAARVFMVAERGATYGQFVADNHGSFQAEGLLPGTYRAGIVVGDFIAGPGNRIVGDDTFTLVAGQRLERSFVFAWRRMTITILQADGKTPAANRSLFVGSPQSRKFHRTDEAGVLVLDPAPREPVKILLPSGEQIGEVQQPEGQNQHEVTLTLPAGK